MDKDIAVVPYYLKNVFQEVADAKMVRVHYYNPSEAVRQGRCFIPLSFREVAQEAKIGGFAGDERFAMLYFGIDLESDDLRKELISVETKKLVATVNDEMIKVRLKDPAVSMAIDVEESSIRLRVDENYTRSGYHGGMKNYQQLVKILVGRIEL